MSFQGVDSGAPSRVRILRAARALFAERGFEGTTIRAVAADAGIDPALVMRYFRNKEGLYTAATAVDLNLGSLSHIPRRQLGQALAERFLELWESESTGPSLRVLLATSRTDVAREAIIDIFTSQLVPVFDDGDAAGAFRSGLIASQLLGFALTRYILALSPIAELDRMEAVTWLAPPLQFLVDLRHP